VKTRIKPFPAFFNLIQYGSIYNLCYFIILYQRKLWHTCNVSLNPSQRRISSLEQQVSYLIYATRFILIINSLDWNNINVDNLLVTHNSLCHKQNPFYVMSRTFSLRCVLSKVNENNLLKNFFKGSVKSFKNLTPSVIFSFIYILQQFLTVHG